MIFWPFGSFKSLVQGCSNLFKMRAATVTVWRLWSFRLAFLLDGTLHLPGPAWLIQLESQAVANRCHSAGDNAFSFLAPDFGLAFLNGLALQVYDARVLLKVCCMVYIFENITGDQTASNLSKGFLLICFTDNAFRLQLGSGRGFWPGYPFFLRRKDNSLCLSLTRLAAS